MLPWKGCLYVCEGGEREGGKGKLTLNQLD